jgi:enamine deaminase RidA (YjgF/YER057c/UK114 family)
VEWEDLILSGCHVLAPFLQRPHILAAMEPVNPPALAKPRGYNHGTVGVGRVLFVAGQIGWNERAEIVSDRFADQFDQALANALTVVHEAGGSPQSIGRLTVYVVDKSEYLAAQAEIGERYRARMGYHYPAMTLVEVKSLLEEGAKVEIEATALLDRK